MMSNLDIIKSDSDFVQSYILLFLRSDLINVYCFQNRDSF